MSDAIAFNPFDPDFRIDPYPVYRRLQQEDPVHRSPLGILVLSRYDDCIAVLRDTRWSSDARNSTAYQNMVENLDTPLLSEAFEGMRPFLFLDPPDHSRLRGLVAKAFTPKVVEGLRPRAQQLVDELVARALEAGSLELIEDLAYPLPVTVISEMLGVPPEDNETFKGWSRELARSLDPDFVLPADVIERRQKAALAFVEYFKGLIAERRARPRDDLLSALIDAEERGDRLTENELLATLILLLVAGHETTVNLIGNGCLALVRHPDQLDRLRDDPALARSAIEELLRYDPPVQLTGRIALDDIEVANGEATVPKGGEVIVLLAAANRDPGAFPDPDALDLGRADNHHLAFGFGIHHCLGAPLARLEGQLALVTLVQRLPDLALAGDPVYKENIVLRGLAELPLTFSAA